MDQYVTLNANAGAAPPNTIILTAVPNAAQPTVFPLAGMGNAGVGSIVLQSFTDPTLACICPTCGRGGH